MTQSDFTSFYPQFAGFTPAVVMTEYIRQANARFAAFTPEDAEEARRLYTAHQLTLYARSAPPEGIPPIRAVLASAGQAPQRITGKKIVEVSVTYATAASPASGSGQAEPADLRETAFGLQLLAILRRYRRSLYVP